MYDNTPLPHAVSFADLALGHTTENTLADA